MASKTLIDTALKLYQSLGGNVSKVLGTRTNVNFLGKGKSSELMVDMDINPDALGVLPQSKAVEELDSAMGYLTSGKLNDMQANKLISNMQKMKDFYMPPAAPANITDLATGTRNLDKEGLMSLRDNIDLPEGVDPRDTILPTRNVFGLKDYDTSTMSSGKQKIIQLEEKLGKLNADAPNFRETAKPLVDEIELRSKFPNASDKDINDALRLGIKDLDDLPPPGSRGGPDDIAEPSFSGAGLEAIKNVKGSNLIINDIVDKIYLNAGVAPAAQPVVRANARDFLNRIKDLTDEPGNPSLSDIMEADDFKFMTEGGGGGMGDPLLLVQKYFGPKVAAAVAKLDTPNDIQLFAERLISVTDDAGRTVTDRRFNPETVDIDDFEFADGGRVPFSEGGGADAKYMFIPPKFLTMKGISEDPSLKIGGFGLEEHDKFYDKFGKYLNPLYYMEKLLEKRNKVKKADGGIARLPMFMGGATRMGYQALRKYGIEAEDITKLFKSLATDKSLVGREKTEYFKQLNKVLKNPDDFPEGIREIQIRLGIDPIGFKGGGLAKILEV
jgi:hypothetical protein